jgi:hypothetical protein
MAKYAYFLGPHKAEKSSIEEAWLWTADILAQQVFKLICSTKKDGIMNATLILQTDSEKRKSFLHLGNITVEMLELGISRLTELYGKPLHTSYRFAAHGRLEILENDGIRFSTHQRTTHSR